MKNFFVMLARFDRKLVWVLEWICIVLFAAITFILTLNIVVRFVPVMSMHLWNGCVLSLQTFPMN